MEENYDYIILGTGYNECLLSGLLAYSGKRVLHMDRNPNYGLETATLTIKEAYNYYSRPPSDLTSKQSALGSLNAYSIDLCPKFVMAGGDMFSILKATGVSRYMEFSVIEETFVYLNKTLSKVPVTPREALTSSLVGFFQKNRLRGFITFVMNVKEDQIEKECENRSSKELMDYYKLDQKTQSLVYHVLGFYVNENDINVKGSSTDLIRRIKNYQNALLLAKKSPFIYPFYGLGMLPEGFSRLASVYNGVYMLNKPFDSLLMDENNKVKGIISENEKAYAPVVIANHCYFPDEVKKVGKIARYLLITKKQPLYHVKEGIGSFMLVIPGVEFGRQSDVYVTVVSSAQKVATEGRYLMMISCVKEKECDDFKETLNKYVLPILMKEEWSKEVIDSFYREDDLVERMEKGEKERKGLFVMGSVDPSSHFEESTKEVMKVYEEITGEKIDLEEIRRKDLDKE